MTASLTSGIRQILTKELCFITAINFLVMLADYQFFVTTALYAIKVFAAPLSEAGAVAGLFVIGCLVARFFAGNLITVLGSKRTLCIGGFF